MLLLHVQIGQPGLWSNKKKKGVNCFFVIRKYLLYFYISLYFSYNKKNILKIIVNEHLLGAKCFTYIIPTL